MKVNRVDHQSLENKGFDLSLFDRLSRYCCFDRRIDSITLFLRFLKVFYSLGVSICLALWYALVRFLISLRIVVLSMEDQRVLFLQFYWVYILLLMNNNEKFRSFKSKENIHMKEVGPYRGFGY